MVNNLRVGRVFIAGGQLSNFFRFIGGNLMRLVQMQLIAILQQGARYDISFAFIHSLLNSLQGMNSSIQDSVSILADCIIN